MIKNTFTFIPGIGAKTEGAYWEKGIVTWEDFERAVCRNGIGATNKKVLIDYVQKAKEALARKDISFFANHLPAKDHWRLYKEFYDRAVFLDIETTGLSQYYDVITLVGAFDGKAVKLFVRDNNLDQVVQYLRKFDIIVTFNGTLFDIPFLKNEFPEIRIPPVHIDLRFLLKTVGVSGPLKVIEQKLGITRDNETKKINGREAAVLWSRFVREDDESLAKLVRYNIYDTTDLKKVMDYCYKAKINIDVLKKINKDRMQQTLFNEDMRDYFTSTPPSSNFLIPKITTRRANSLLELRGGRKLLLRVSRKAIKKPEIKLNELTKKIRKTRSKPLSVGIDLTGSETRPSGVCVLDGNKAYMSLVKTDEEIIAKTLAANPAVVSIDSPLSLPKGRDCASDSCTCRKFGIMRECERLLKRRGINVYPCLIPSMQKMTLRGMNLAKALEERGLLVIESYPGAAQDIMGFPRKRVDLKALEVDLFNMGIKPYSDKEVITHDEIDALTSALVGYFYLTGMYEAIGNPEEKYLIIPDLKRK
jgi:uncharacterized protein YprB with RNaseH-like and TPR domain/predicted nuclease with RNAse H fold